MWWRAGGVLVVVALAALASLIALFHRLLRLLADGEERP